VDVEDAITEGLRGAGMKETQRAMVRLHLHDPPDPRSCCGSSCDPCVATLAVAVKIARRHLGLES
jgi:hypothetical protein